MREVIYLEGSEPQASANALSQLLKLNPDMHVLQMTGTTFVRPLPGGIIGTNQNGVVFCLITLVETPGSIETGQLGQQQQKEAPVIGLPKKR